MRFDWVDSPLSIDRSCPVCGAGGEKRVRLTVAAERAGNQCLQLLDCASCGSAFYDDLNPPDYDAAHRGAGFLKFHVELGAGPDAMIAPLYRIDLTRVRTYLEVGCGFGFSLDFARFAFGWTVRGMDPSPLAAAGREILGLDVESAYLARDTDFGARYDLVLCSEVLEHLPAPAELIGLLARTVSDDGALILTTPNVRSLRRDAPPAVTRSILAPGFHLIFYSRESLEMLLRKNGFSHVRVWEHETSLHAVAAHRPRTTRDEAVLDRTAFRRYLRSRIADLQPDSPVVAGLAYRLFKDLVSAGDFREADEVYLSLRDSFRRVYGIDLDAPSPLTLEKARELPFEEFARRHPFNLCGVLYFKGMGEFLGRRDSPRAIEYLRAAFRAGTVISAMLSSISITDCETENLACQARINLLYALAVVDPAAAVDEFLGLCDPQPANGADVRLWSLPLALVDSTRKELFVRLACQGDYDEAGTLLRGVTAALPAGSKIAMRLGPALENLAGHTRERSPVLARLQLQVVLDNLTHDRHDEVSASWLGTGRVLLSALARRLNRLVRRPGR